MYKSIFELCHFLNLEPAQLSLAKDSNFPLKVPYHFAKQIQKGNPNDPLLRQVLPTKSETTIHPDFSTDPVGDLSSNPLPGLIHKYHGRVLLITSPRCDIHCRYCFRQHFPYEQSKKNHWITALKEIANNPTIEEVILSGGDPFTLSENALVDLIKKIATISHVTTIRFHSRSAIAAPDKSPQKKFLTAIKSSRLNMVLVVHCNHPNELSNETLQLMTLYKNSGMTLLNQTVLLKNINDEVNILSQLSKSLFNQGVLPYYCHLLDKVSGSTYFEVSKPQAQILIQKLRKQLPGYLVPQLVEEIAGEPYKTPVNFLERPFNAIS